MTKVARIAKIMTLLRGKPQGVGTKELLGLLEVSRSTLFLDMGILRDQLGHPIVFDRTDEVWRLKMDPHPLFPRDELPGVWVTPDESYALLTLLNVLRGIDPGFLEEYVHPLRGLLKRIILKRNYATPSLSRKVAIELGEFAKVKPGLFSKISEALIRDKKLAIAFADGAAQVVCREISPQQIVLTPEGWSLTFQDHSKNILRTIPISRISSAKVLSVQAVLHPSFKRFPSTRDPDA